MKATVDLGRELCDVVFYGGSRGEPWDITLVEDHYSGEVLYDRRWDDARREAAASVLAAALAAVREEFGAGSDDDGDDDMDDYTAEDARADSEEAEGWCVW